MNPYTSVCYGCTERHAGCGAQCEKYKAEREKRQKDNEKRLEDSKVTNAQIEFGRGRRRKR